MRWQTTKDWPVKEGTTRIVVESFLQIHRLWFETPGNSFHNRYDACLEFLIGHVEHASKPPLIDRHGFVYLAMKFDTEFMKDYKLVPDTGLDYDTGPVVT